jgi:hypothetical protein
MSQTPFSPYCSMPNEDNRHRKVVCELPGTVSKIVTLVKNLFLNPLGSCAPECLSYSPSFTASQDFDLSLTSDWRNSVCATVQAIAIRPIDRQFGEDSDNVLSIGFRLPIRHLHDSGCKLFAGYMTQKSPMCCYVMISGGILGSTTLSERQGDAPNMVTNLSPLATLCAWESLLFRRLSKLVIIAAIWLLPY